MVTDLTVAGRHYCLAQTVYYTTDQLNFCESMHSGLTRLLNNQVVLMIIACAVRDCDCVNSVNTNQQRGCVISEFEWQSRAVLH